VFWDVHDPAGAVVIHLADERYARLVIGVDDPKRRWRRSAAPSAQPTPDDGQRRPVEHTALLVGGVCGLAWAAGLRGFMAQIAGSTSGVDWGGTFGWILLPGIGVGALLGWAEHLRTSGGQRGWRWLALAPLLFSAILFSRPLDILSIFQDGVGGGAIGVPLYGMLGGYALSVRGPRWARILSGAVALTAIPIWALTVTSFAGPDLALNTPRGAWVAVYYWSFLAVLMLACAPHRAVTPPHAA
jgi:hypothetical protein